jgi:hypothetical protein
LTFLWLQERLQEHLTKWVIWVFVDLCMIFLLGVQLLWLLCKLVDRNLSNNKREIFSSWIIHLSILDLRGSNMRLVRKLKDSIHIV